jgi:flagellar biosynthesis GTPase FlhF
VEYTTVVEHRNTALVKQINIFCTGFVQKGDGNMATVKKTAAPAATTKVEASKAEEKKAASAAPVKSEAKTTAKEAEKAPAPKKETAKKTPAKKPAAKKAELKSEISVQFGGKSYSQEELVKIAKDVWKYDLKKKAADLTSVELYVKPEENMVYYVMNKEITGSFSI